MNPSNPRPLTGVFQGKTHLMPFRIYYENTDMGGIVYHAEYIKLLERSRTEYMRTLGFNQIDLLNEKNLMFVLFDLAIQYKKPAKMDDQILVKTVLVDHKNTFFTFNQEIFCEQTLLATAHLKVCCINHQNNKPHPIPKDLLSAIKNL